MLLERFGEPIGDNQGVPTSDAKKDMGNRGFGGPVDEACCDQCGMMPMEMDGEHSCQENDLDEKAPPGGEKVVKALKKQKGVDNPFAVAWAMKNKGDKFNEGLNEAPKRSQSRKLQKKKAVSKPKKQTAPQLMAQIVDALKKIGYRPKERNRNGGVIRTWLKGPPPSIEQVETIVQTLTSAKLPVTLRKLSSWEEENGRDYEIEGSSLGGFKITVPSSIERAKSGMGSDVAALISVYAGQYAEDERSGIDTGDYSGNMGSVFNR